MHVETGQIKLPISGGTHYHELPPCLNCGSELLTPRIMLSLFGCTPCMKALGTLHRGYSIRNLTCRWTNTVIAVAFVFDHLYTGPSLISFDCSFGFATTLSPGPRCRCPTLPDLQTKKHGCMQVMHLGMPVARLQTSKLGGGSVVAEWCIGSCWYRFPLTPDEDLLGLWSNKSIGCARMTRLGNE